MTENGRPKKPPVGVPEAIVEERPRGTISLIWVVPLIAALIGGWLAWHALSQRGPTITIQFANADGLEVGKTKIRYKNVDIGLVKELRFSPDRKYVEVVAEMQPEVEGWLVEDSRFWVVRPRIAVTGISGLGTLFSGAFIGMDVGGSTERKLAFKGLETQPVIEADVPGSYFLLRTDSLGSVGVGAPVYYRRVPVGEVVAYHLNPDSGEIEIEIFINAPFDNKVTLAARFWYASGLDFRLDSRGVRLSTESLASLIQGGISFQPTADEAISAPPAPAGAQFWLHPDRETALARDHSVYRDFAMYFHESVRGLAVGADVEFLGIPIGEVRRISADFDRVGEHFSIRVDVRYFPERLLPEMTTRTREERDRVGRDGMVAKMVAKGLRAQLRTGSLLTGQLYVALDFFPDAAVESIDFDQDPPVIPTMPSGLESLQQRLSKILEKLEALPVDGIGQDLRNALQTTDRSLGSIGRLAENLDKKVLPELVAALDDAQQALSSADRAAADFRQVTAADGYLQTDVREALQELAAAARSVRELAAYLERHPEALVRGKGSDQ